MATMKMVVEQRVLKSPVQHGIQLLISVYKQYLEFPDRELATGIEGEDLKQLNYHVIILSEIYVKGMGCLEEVFNDLFRFNI